MLELSLDFIHRNDVVQRTKEPVRGLEVRAGLDVKVGFQSEPPASLSVSESFAQPLRCVASLQIERVKMACRSRLDMQRDGSEALPGIVGPVDTHRPVPGRMVDDPGEPGKAARRPDQRKGVLGHRRRRRAARPDKSNTKRECVDATQHVRSRGHSPLRRRN